jgi:hypothetical protein
MTAKTARLPPKAQRFYEEALTQAERADFPVALDVEGVDQEIAVLRLRLRTALKANPEDLQLMLRGVVMLVQALAAKYRLPKEDQEALVDVFANETEGQLWVRQDPAKDERDEQPG